MNYSFNALIRIFIALFCFFYSAVVFISNNSESSSKYFGLAQFALGIWCLFDGIEGLVESPRYIILMQSFIYISAEVSACSLLLFAAGLSSVIKRKSAIRFAYALPLLFLIATMLLFLFTDEALFLKMPSESFVLVSSEFFLPGYIYPKRFAYYIHAAYCYSIVPALIATFSYNGLKNFRENKKIFVLLAAGMTIFLIPNFHKFFIENYRSSGYDDIQEFFYSLCIFFMSSLTFYALQTDKNHRCVALCNKSMYDDSSLPIFVFNGEKRLLQLNRSAVQFLSRYRITPKKFDRYDRIFSEETFITLGTNEDSSAMSEFYLSGTADKKLYFARMSGIFINERKLTGYWLALFKLDFYDAVIRHLENALYADSVTGLQKRGAFIEQVANLLQKRGEPLILLCAAIDDFETLNGSLGFDGAEGYVKHFALLLQQELGRIAAPQPGSAEEAAVRLFRVNDFAFAAILFMEHEDKIPSFLKSIRQECARFSKGKERGLSCSIGYSVTAGDGVSAAEFFQQSYDNMLLNRKSKRLDCGA